MPEYKYTPLLTEHNSTRMLRILPAEESSAKVECQLFNFTFPESGATGSYIYEALSYVWGSSDRTKLISVDSFDFAVKENLHAALVYSRPLSRTSSLG